MRGPSRRRRLRAGVSPKKSWRRAIWTASGSMEGGSDSIRSIRSTGRPDSAVFYPTEARGRHRSGIVGKPSARKEGREGASRPVPSPDSTQNCWGGRVGRLRRRIEQSSVHISYVKTKKGSGPKGYFSFGSLVLINLIKSIFNYYNSRASPCSCIQRPRSASEIESSSSSSSSSLPASRACRSLSTGREMGTRCPSTSRRMRTR